MIREVAFVLAVLGSPNLYAQPMVIIRAVEPDRSGSSGSFVKRYGLDRQDAHSLPEFVRGIQAIQLSASRLLFVNRANPQTLESEMKAAMLTAVSPAHRIRRNFRIVQGSDLQKQDFSQATSRCLISTDFATWWFGTQSAVG